MIIRVAGSPLRSHSVNFMRIGIFAILCGEAGNFAQIHCSIVRFPSSAVIFKAGLAGLSDTLTTSLVSRSIE